MVLQWHAVAGTSVWLQDMVQETLQVRACMRACVHACVRMVLFVLGGGALLFCGSFVVGNVCTFTSY